MFLVGVDGEVVAGFELDEWGGFVWEVESGFALEEEDEFRLGLVVVGAGWRGMVPRRDDAFDADGSRSAAMLCEDLDELGTEVCGNIVEDVLEIRQYLSPLTLLIIWGQPPIKSSPPPPSMARQSPDAKGLQMK